MEKTIHLKYFAILREQAGCAGETLTTKASDATALYQELRTKHGFTLNASQIRVAVDSEYKPIDTPLTDGIHLTFIPPVAGG